MGLSALLPSSSPSRILCRIAAGIPLMITSPLLRAQAPGMPALKAGEATLGIESLDIQVEVVGTLARTTWDITFRNPQHRVLEGELVFPLGEGQTVSRFALPVNGILREGVVVPKAKGREAFEAVVRRPTQVDPGLLEKTEGNAFRTRIYPIPALGTYRVVLAYEQELTPQGKELRYLLPLAFTEQVGRCSFKVAVEAQEATPGMAGPLPGLRFRSAGRGWRAEAQGTNVSLDHPLDLRIPQSPGLSATAFHQEAGARAFYTRLTLPSERRAKPVSNRILVVWDASASAARRDLPRERRILANYLRALGEVRVDVVLLRDAMEAPLTFQIHQGRVQALLAFLERAPLDGGTRMDALRLAGHQADEVLLFSDGLSNLGSWDPALPPVPLTTLSSAPHARHTWLRSQAETRHGEYLNLLERKDDAEVLTHLRTQPLIFLGAQGEPGDLYEIYPKPGAAVRGTFAVAGLQTQDRSRLHLSFGYGAKVAFTRDVLLDPGSGTDHPLVRRIWAQKKLANLSVEPQRYRDDILRLGQEHGIVTDESSLIVLETVQDYARFRITPPAELRPAYDQLVARESQRKAEDADASLRRVAAKLEEEKRWWETSFKPEPPPVPVDSKLGPTPQRAQPPVAPMPQPTPSTGVIHGVVRDALGRPVTQAQVRIQGLAGGFNRTTITDALGAYSLHLLAPGEASLRITREGFNPTQVQVTVQANQAIELPVLLQESTSATVEVVASVASVDQSAALGTESLASIPRGRDAAGIVSLAPGVSGGVFARPENRFQVDGLDVSAAAPSGPAQGRVEVAAWSSHAPYLDAMKTAKPQERYAAYLNLRKAYGAAPGFYLDLCDVFEQAGDRKLARRVLSNLAELGLDHPGLLRVLGHRLLQLGEVDLAIHVFERVLRLREEEPQSLRDLALALAQGGQVQKAADALYQVAIGNWDSRFGDVDIIALNEFNALCATQKVNASAYDPRLRANLPVDVRVVLTWDTNDSDMDLHVTDPRGERCMYSHTRTAIGGRISRDMTQGYGPEEFLLHKAVPGTYTIEANYFGTRQQHAVVGPTTLKAELILHFGTPQEVRKPILVRLDGRGEMVKVGTFRVEGP